MTRDFEVDSEFAEYMFRTSDVADDDLEASLVAAGGPHDSLKVAVIHVDGKSVAVLMDGHRRLVVCEKHRLVYSVERIPLPSREAVFEWMDAFQLARRNLTPQQEATARGRMVKRRIDGGQKAEIAVAEVAKRDGVSDRQVYRNLDKVKKIESVDKAVRKDVECCTESEIAFLAALPKRDQRDVVKSWKDGEFSSLRSAIKGEPVEDATDSPPPEPVVATNATQQAQKEALHALGKLKDAVVSLYRAKENRNMKATVGLHLGKVSEILEAWVR